MLDLARVGVSIATAAGVFWLVGDLNASTTKAFGCVASGYLGILFGEWAGTWIAERVGFKI